LPLITSDDHISCFEWIERIIVGFYVIS
jgi:hypothetical protein